MQGRQLPQELLGFFVAHFGSFQDDLNDLIALRSLARVRNAALAQAEFLAVLGAGRNFEQGLAVDRRHFDFGAEAGFPDGDGDLHVDVVAFTAEDRMLLDMSGDVEIAGGGAHGAGVALAGDAQTRAIFGSGGDADFDHLFVGDASIAVAVGARVLDAALAFAARAGEIELHIARHLLDVPGAVALRAGDGARVITAGAVTDAAQLVAGDFNFGLEASDGLPERNVEAVLEVGALFGGGVRFGLIAAAAEELAEDVFERAAGGGATAGSAAVAAVAGGLGLGVAEHLGEIEAVEVHVRTGTRTAATGRRSRGE